LLLLLLLKSDERGYEIGGQSLGLSELRGEVVAAAARQVELSQLRRNAQGSHLAAAAAAASVTPNDQRLVQAQVENALKTVFVDLSKHVDFLFFLLN